MEKYIFTGLKKSFDNLKLAEHKTDREIRKEHTEREWFRRYAQKEMSQADKKQIFNKKPLFLCYRTADYCQWLVWKLLNSKVWNSWI